MRDARHRPTPTIIATALRTLHTSVGRAVTHFYVIIVAREMDVERTKCVIKRKYTYD